MQMLLYVDKPSHVAKLTTDREMSNLTKMNMYSVLPKITKKARRSL